MPYIYSLAWRVTNEDYTMQRPLIMDWRTVDKVRDIGDQFMFGPSILVSPVTFSGATTRGLYLPPSTGWFDFWTGKRLSGDQSIEASAPLNRIPLYVRAGSILPLGPEIQYATERSDSPITLRVYTGADAKFDLYEDDGSSYNYEHGEQAIIPISWDEATQTLIIGERVGAFPGMPNKRTFRIVWVANGHGAGDSLKEAADKVISYDGKNVVIKKPSRVSLAQRHK
jgi:alpha-D-xyloside xylohydrolase